jgi:hypothetical protein
MATQQSRPAATNCETAQDLSAGSVKSVPIVSQARPSVARFDSRRVRARRLVVRELDEFLGLFKYPDVASLYAMPPSREPE